MPERTGDACLGGAALVARGLDDWDHPRSPAGVRLLVLFAAELGVPAEVCLAGAGIAPALLEDPHGLVQASQEIAVVRNVLRAAGDRPGLGLRAGARFHLTTFGAWGYTLLACSTLREALRTGMQFAELSFAFCALTITEDGGSYTARWSWDGLPTDVRRFLLERDCAAGIALRRELLADPSAMRLRRVTLGFPAPDPAPYEEFFGVPVEVGADATVLESDSAALDRPLPQADSPTARDSADRCRRLAAEHSGRAGASHALRARMRRLGATDEGIERAAQALGRSSRTLRRRLEAEGTSYRHLVEEARFEAALQALRTGRPSTDELSRRLGYSEPSSFIRAFRRWSGTTPQRWLNSPQHRV
jgi:AraC-like DNA-binding protein